ncbi:thioredoxin-like [Conger conger]|uniref:thioredoxin-like n=1 Tax=Conger conger TaxID=82655 RepID=UPI002A59F608|nr:thioredoxin-like [Conger conger]
MVKYIENQAQFDQALKDAGGKLVVVDFTATWCPPCRSIGPKFKGHSENPEFSSVVFLKVDVDEASDVSENCKIGSMPTFHFYKNGKKIDEFSGADENKLLKKLHQHK